MDIGQLFFTSQQNPSPLHVSVLPCLAFPALSCYFHTLLPLTLTEHVELIADKRGTFQPPPGHLVQGISHSVKGGEGRKRSGCRGRRRRMIMKEKKEEEKRWRNEGFLALCMCLLSFFIILVLVLTLV